MKYGCIFIVLFFLNQTFAQPVFQNKNYSTGDGLSSNTVGTLVKDEHGFLWIGTSNGLNRFDGNAFDHFYNNPADSNSIASSEINNLFIDHKKNLWITTMAGLSLYQPHSQTFSNYAPDTFLLPKIGQLYPAIEEDNAGNIWLGGWYDLLIFNPASKKFTSSGWAKFEEKIKPVNGNHSRVVVLGLKHKNEKEFWVLTTYGLFSVDTKSLQFAYYPFPEIKDFYGCQLSYVDQQGNVWIGTYQNGIISYHPSINKWISHATPVAQRQDGKWDWAYGISNFSNDTLVYSSQKELVFLMKDAASATVKMIENKNAEAGGGYTQIIKDGKNYWLLSYRGLTKMYPAENNFTLVKPSSIVNTDRIYPVVADEKLVAGSPVNKTIYLVNKIDKASRIIKNNTGQPLKGSLTSFKQIDGQLTLLGTDEKLYRYNEISNSCAAIGIPQKTLSNNPDLLRNIVTNNRGIAWIRNRRQGIIEYDYINNKISYLNICKTDEQTTFSSMYFDSVRNALWVGVENAGIYIFNVGNKTVQHHLFNIPPSQKGATITCFTGGNNNSIYGCDINYGLFSFNVVTKKFNRYTTHDGLISNNCNFVCKDAVGNIWISSAEGISRFDTAAKTFTNFPELKDAANYAAFISADEKGNLFLPCSQGYYQWNINNFSKEKPVGKIYLRNCLAAELSLPIDSTYQFNYGQNNLSFQFGYLSYNHDEIPVLQYKLNNGEWINLKNENIVSFSNLAANIYLLQVREKSHPLLTLSIAFIINPPFYKSWWFLLSVVIAAAAVVFLFFKRRLSSIKKQAALKQKIAETEMMALRAQMNPHFIFNCISSIDNFILDNDKENASSYLNKFAKLIRNILDNSKNEVVPFWKDWETLKLYLELEQLRSNHRFDYTLHADDELLNGHYKIPPLIIQPYIENAIHHGLNALEGKQGNLLIEASIKDQELQYRIKDNGIGRKKAAEKKQLTSTHQSYGMQLTKERIDLFNEVKDNAVSIQDLYENDGGPAGTLVSVLLKI